MRKVCRLYVFTYVDITTIETSANKIVLNISLSFCEDLTGGHSCNKNHEIKTNLIYDKLGPDMPEGFDYLRLYKYIRHLINSV